MQGDYTILEAASEEAYQLYSAEQEASEALVARLQQQMDHLQQLLYAELQVSGPPGSGPVGGKGACAGCLVAAARLTRASFRRQASSRTSNT